jgi:uroporphyrinogen decarboxylase
MTARDRVWAALKGEAVDRPPISFWGHFYHRESSAEDLVQATLEFHRAYGWDWVKLNPRKHYHVEPWGVSYRYSGRATEKPHLDAWPIHVAEDWNKVEEQPLDRGALAEQLAAVRLLKTGLQSDVPFIETVFTPLAILGEMVNAPEVLQSHLRTHPQAVHHALEAVTRTFERFAREVVKAGADGIYLATVDWASRDRMTPEEYRTWARPYDERILAAVAGAPFNVLHVCKQRNLLLELADYPVAAFSWAATDPSNPSMADLLPRIKGAVMGGISHEHALQQSSSEAVVAEVRHGFEQTGGARWLVAPGCSIPPETPAANLSAVRAALETQRTALQSSPSAPSTRGDHS